MLTLMVATWRHYGRRYLATGLAVAIGVGFAVAAATLTADAKRGAEDAAAVQYAKADVVALPQQSVSRPLLERIRRLPGVADAAVVGSAFLQVRWPGSSPSGESVSELAAPSSLRWQQLVSGRFATRYGEVVLDEGLADGRGVAVGDSLLLSSGDGKPEQVTVVGLVRSSDASLRVPALFVAPGTFHRWHITPATSEIDVADTAGTSATAVAAEVRAADPGLDVSTAARLRTQAVSAFTNRVDVMGRLLAGFAVVALFVTGLVIANTFRVVVAQRARDTALLRCVGAVRRQVLALTIGEGLLLGVAGSLAGAALGSALVVGLVATAGSTFGYVPLANATPTASALLEAGVAGVLVTVLAIVPAAASAARARPLAALQRADDPGSAATVRPRDLLWAGVGALGCLVMTAGAARGLLPFGVAGGVLSFVAVLALTRLVVPRLVCLVGRFLALLLHGGGTTRLAVANTVRNPRRTSATAGALLVGVTLVSTLYVGAASVSATESSAVDRVAPVDVVVSATAMRPGLPGRLAAVEGVDKAVIVRAVRATTGAGAAVVGSLGPAGAAEVVRDPVLSELLSERPRDPGGPWPVLIPVTQQGAVPGGRSTPFVLHLGGTAIRVAPTYTSLPDGPMLVAPAALRQLGAAAGGTPGAVYLRLADGADPTEVLSRVEAVADTGSAGVVSVSSGFAERSSYDDIMAGMLTAATALIAVAVGIALVGVANTLSLSVLERRRENGLLRALGMTPRQLRSMLAGEAVLTAFVAAALGAALGIGYGWLGAVTLLHGALNHAPTLSVPGWRLVLVCGVVAAAALVASLLPARRAVRESPVAALAAD